MENRLDILGSGLGFEESALEASDDTPKRSLADFLYPTPAPRNAKGIVKWWESRRIQYNVIVGASGFLSMGIFSLLMSLPPFAHNLAFTWGPVLGFGILANIFYFLGPTAELAIEKISRGKILPTGPGLFRMGLTFSVGLTLLPTLMASIDWALRIFRWIF